MACGRKSPRAPLRSNFDDPDGWEPTESRGDQLSFPRLAKYIAWTLWLVAQASSAVRQGVPVRARDLRWYMGTKLGRRQSRAKFARRLSRATTSLRPISTVVKMPLLPYLDVPVGFLDVVCRVNSRHPVAKLQPRKGARSLTNLR